VSNAAVPLRRPPLTAAAPRAHVRPRRSPGHWLRITVGLLWLLDAGLQFQPFMFGRAFVTQVVQPAGRGDPAIVAHTMAWAAHLMLAHIAFYNSIFASTQLALAIAILVPRTTRIGLWASIGWSLLIWLFGEGLGGVLSGGTPVTGAPGGVILYGLAAAMLLTPAADERRSSVVKPAGSHPPQAARSGRSSALAVRLAWSVLWAVGAWLLLLPGNRSPSAMSSAIAANASGQAQWVKDLVGALVQLTAHRGTEVSLGFAVMCLAIAVGPWVRALERPALVAAVILGLTWWVAQGFGGIFTGQGTDPNSGVLFVVVAAVLWPWSEASRDTTEPGSQVAHGRTARPDLPAGGVEGRLALVSG
jgi:hypothetical protein